MDFVFEIGCEELPAHFVEPALDQMESFFRSESDNLRIDFEQLETLGTPRRLALLVYDLADSQRSLEKTVTGPPVATAFENGEPTGAARGFANAKGVDVTDLYTVEKSNGEFAAADIHEKGEATKQLLPDLLEKLIGSLEFPKSMRWADYEARFARPVRWIAALAGGEKIGLEFAGVESDTATRGHRFAAPDSFEIESPDQYKAELRERHVIVDARARRQQIEKKLETLSREVGGQIRTDPELIDEVTYLIEKPHATRLDFDETYLELPDEVLITSMRSHQRYFSIVDPESGQLLPHCGVIYNTPVRTPDKVRRGNARVLKARLDDAKFFWEKDKSQKLETYLDELENVVWVQGLGTMRDRTDRIGDLAGRLAENFELETAQCRHARRAGQLSKADLVTEMVGEFSSLQGIMGREYAKASGEPEPVATAIGQQYLPAGTDDDLPDTDVGACVAMAEKLDSLIGCFGVDMIPSSDSDPYGLRRAALGVLRILDERQFRTNLPELIELSYGVYANRQPEHFGEVDKTELTEKLESFIRRRLRYRLAEAHPKDVVDAVIAVQTGDVDRITGLVEALSSIRSNRDFEPLARGFKRISNILDAESSAPSGEIDEDALIEQEEQALYDAYLTAQNDVEAALQARDWNGACERLIDLKQPVDAFFDTVMVNADDETLRQNRLALLSSLRQLFFRVADISRIVLK